LDVFVLQSGAIFSKKINGLRLNYLDEQHKLQIYLFIRTLCAAGLQILIFCIKFYLLCRCSLRAQKTFLPIVDDISEQSGVRFFLIYLRCKRYQYVSSIYIVLVANEPPVGDAAWGSFFYSNLVPQSGHLFELIMP
jgi:hypothetical protein